MENTISPCTTETGSFSRAWLEEARRLRLKGAPVWNQNARGAFGNRTKQERMASTLTKMVKDGVVVERKPK